MSSTTVSGTDLREHAATLRERLDRPGTPYYIVLAVTIVLVLLGLAMVVSASAVDSLKDGGAGSVFTLSRTQAIYATIGAVAMLVASRVPVLGWKRLALVILAVGIAIQAVIQFTSHGQYSNGNVNWLRIGPVRLQASEIIKVGLALSGGLLLAPRRHLLGQLKHLLTPYHVPGALLGIGLVIYGGDLGTALVLCAIVAAILFTAGVPGRWFAAVGALAAAGLLTLVVTAPYRLSRFDVWLGKDTDPLGNYRQPLHAKYALADGGIFGIGLGQSREKWEWLSEPHNDFIFAIIGEELGLIGTLSVLGLFLLLLFACYRMVERCTDMFVRLATAGIAAWIGVQAMINMGAVTGMLPIIGVPLPLVSSGGSSLITTMFALGILLAFARTEPGAAETFARHGQWWRAHLPAGGRWRRKGDA